MSSYFKYVVFVGYVLAYIIYSISEYNSTLIIESNSLILLSISIWFLQTLSKTLFRLPRSSFTYFVIYFSFIWTFFLDFTWSMSRLHIFRCTYLLIFSKSFFKKAICNIFYKNPVSFIRIYYILSVFIVWIVQDWQYYSIYEPILNAILSRIMLETSL